MDSIKRIRDFFRSNFSYVGIEEMSDESIIDFMDQYYLKGMTFERQMECLYDYILSQNCCEIVE